MGLRQRDLQTTVRGAVTTLIVSHLAVAGGVYALTDKRPVDTEAKHTGFFQIDATKVLATTVESLRDENKLLVFSYKGNARVHANVASSARYSHLANDTLLAAVEAGAARQVRPD